MVRKYAAGGRGSLRITCPCFLCRHLGLSCSFPPTSQCDVCSSDIKSRRNCVSSKFDWIKGSHQQSQGKGLPVHETFRNIRNICFFWEWIPWGLKAYLERRRSSLLWTALYFLSISVLHSIFLIVCSLRELNSSKKKIHLQILPLYWKKKQNKTTSI